jgi:hypothetical protein
MTYRIRPHLETARKLVQNGDHPSLTYAALELRLGIELMCYEKLRMRLGYVSVDEIRAWRPADVLDALAEVADPHVTQEAVLYVADEGSQNQPATWQKIAEQRKIDPRRLRRIWNKLGNFLHVQLPSHGDEFVVAYADIALLRSRIGKIIAELEPLATGADIHLAAPRTSFTCSCGFTLQRATAMLREGEPVTCINPKCRKEWLVEKRGEGEHGFRSHVVEVSCRRCGHEQCFEDRQLREMRPGQISCFTCDRCGARHHMRCVLDYALVEESSAEADKPAGPEGGKQLD